MGPLEVRALSRPLFLRGPRFLEGHAGPRNAHDTAARPGGPHPAIRRNLDSNARLLGVFGEFEEPAPRELGCGATGSTNWIREREDNF